jgi:hypothetical protein
MSSMVSSKKHTHIFRARYYQKNGTDMTIAEWVGKLLKGETPHTGSFNSQEKPPVE